MVVTLDDLDRFSKSEREVWESWRRSENIDGWYHAMEFDFVAGTVLVWYISLNCNMRDDPPVLFVVSDFPEIFP